MRKISLSTYGLSFIMLVMIMIASNLKWGGDNWKTIVAADGKGYYSYLPAMFIYEDLNFAFFDEIEKEKYYDQNLYYDYRATINGKIINKYYSGTALLQSPFFAIAHLYAKNSDFEADGYSKPYMVAVSVAGLFYLFLGLFFQLRLYKSVELSEKKKLMLLSAMLFGTNLFYYAVVESAMSHVYSFAVISGFTYYSFRHFKGENKTIQLGILFGLVLLIRPVNGLVIFAWPFIAGSKQALWEGIKLLFSSMKRLIIGALVFLGIVSIQLIIYKVSTGSFMAYSYQQEGFNFLNPKMFDILFSYKKGLFLYTPIYLIAFYGLFYLWKHSKFQFAAWIGFFTLITYVFSSWWMWFYGGSFSSRVYVEFLPLFFLLLAIGYKHASRRNSVVLGATLIVFIVFCQIQTFQYRYNHIHWSDMTKESYWEVFMRIDKFF